MDLGRIVSNTQIQTISDLNNRVKELLTLAGSVANLLSFFYFVVFTLIVGMAISMLMQGRTWFGKWATDFGGLGAVVIVPLLVFGIIGTNLNNIRADTIFKQADPLKSQGQWDAAIAHYKVVSALQPNEDFRRMFPRTCRNSPYAACDSNPEASCFFSSKNVLRGRLRRHIPTDSGQSGSCRWSEICGLLFGERQ